MIDISVINMPSEVAPQCEPSFGYRSHQGKQY